MREHQHPLVELTRARILEFVRDPGALFWTFGFPIVLAVALGIAFRESPPSDFRVAFEDGGGAEALAASIEGADGIEVEVLGPHESDRALATGKVDLVVVPRTGDGWAFRFDPMRPESRAARFAIDDALQRAAGREDAVATVDEHVRESGGRYIDFLVPGLIGLNIMGSAIWGIGFAVVDARKRKLLKRLAATPMSRAHFLLSYMLSRLAFLFAEVAALVAFGWLVFDVAVQGSLASLSVVAIWGALALTGIALLIAARPRSTEVASGWANLFMLPMWLLSGAFFSYERFPAATLPFIRALPLTALNDALRAIVNDGASLLAVWPQLGVLTAWGVLSFGLALRLFRWQ